MIKLELSKNRVAEMIEANRTDNMKYEQMVEKTISELNIMLRSLTQC